MNISTSAHLYPRDTIAVEPAANSRAYCLSLKGDGQDTSIYLWDGAIYKLIEALQAGGYIPGTDPISTAPVEVGEPAEQYSGPHRPRRPVYWINHFKGGFTSALHDRDGGHPGPFTTYESGCEYMHEHGFSPSIYEVSTVRLNYGAGADSGD